MSLCIATCQHDISGDVKQNLSAILRQIRYAGYENAEVVHFSECNLSGYAGVNFTSISKREYYIVQKALAEICNLAAKLSVWVIVGSHHFENGMSKPYNSLYIINSRGEVVDRYDKRFLAGMYGDQEPRHYSTGTRPVRFKIKDFSCGLLICHEWRYPELYREYHLQKADMIFQSWYDGNLSTDSYNRYGKELGSLITGTVRGNAANNYLWISASNTSSKQSSFPSFMVQPDGRIMHKLTRNRAGVLISVIDKSHVFVDPSAHNRKRILDENS